MKQRENKINIFRVVLVCTLGILLQESKCIEMSLLGCHGAGSMSKEFPRMAAENNLR